MSEYLERTDNRMKPLSIDDLKDTKKKSTESYVSVAITHTLNEHVNLICHELKCTKAKFVALAINNLINEYERKASE